MNTFKRLLLFIYFVLFFMFVPVFVYGEEIDTTSWLLNGAGYLDFRDSPIFAGGSSTNNGVTISPVREYYVNCYNTISVYYDRSSQNLEDVIYFLTPTPNTGAHQYESYNVAANGPHQNFNWSNMNFTGYNSSTGIIDGDFQNLFNFETGSFSYNQVFVGSIIGLQLPHVITTNSCDYIVSSSQDLYNQLFNSPDDDDGDLSEEENDIYFYLKTYSPSGMLQKSEYTITWDTSNLSNNIDLSKYGIGVYICGSEDALYYNFKNKKAVRSTDQYPAWLNGTAFTFTYQEVANLFPFTSFPETMFYIYLNIVDENNQPISDKWVNWQIVKRVEITDSQRKTWDGSDFTDSEDLGDREDGRFRYTDDRPPGVNTGEDGTPNSNGSEVSQQAHGQGVNNTTPTNPEVSGVDYGSSLSDLSSNLTGLLSTLGNMPMILQTVLGFLPAWLITLFSVSLGLIIVIGTAKLILR